MKTAHITAEHQTKKRRVSNPVDKYMFLNDLEGLIKTALQGLSDYSVCQLYRTEFETRQKTIQYHKSGSKYYV